MVWLVVTDLTCESRTLAILACSGLMGQNKHPLNSDELGAKGESRFREICADAQLICNSSERDRTGWDFIIEFPFSIPGPNTTLDKRVAPISCHIQVKTLWEHVNEFKTRVSSAERLAKEIKPTFICVLKVNHKKQFVDAYLIHINDDPLCKILKRLRKEEARKLPHLINRKFLTFSPSKDGQRIGLSGDSFKAALIKTIGDDLHSYMKMKAENLKKLGYEPQPFETRATLHAGSYDRLIDAFLGLTKVSIYNLATFESRFGIKLLLSEPSGSGIMEIKPNPVDQCTISVSGGPLEKVAIFQGKVFIPPPLILGDDIECMFKTDYFHIRFSKKRGCKFFIDENLFKSSLLTPKQWQDICYLGICFGSGRGEIKVQINNMDGQLVLTINDRAFGNDLEYFRQSSKICLALSTIFITAGATEPNILISDIWKNASQIMTIDEWFTDHTCDLDNFAFSSDRPDNKNELRRPIKVVFASYVIIANIYIGYTLLFDLMPELSVDVIHWKPISMKPLNIRILRDSNSLAPYGEEIKQKSKVDGIITMTPQ
jgi:hypothetical protein